VNADYARAGDGWLRRLSHAVAIVEDTLLVLMVSGMIVLAGLQILLRNVWDSGIVWSDPLLRVAVMWIGLLGAMVATRRDQHIRIDVLSRYLPVWLQTPGRVLTDLFSAVICALLAYHGFRFMLFDWEAGVQAFAGVPAWVCETIIPIGFGVIAVRFLLSALSAQKPVPSA
jgi:TRAP-type C4-dicarboxylate transport system permease small subunit